MASNQPSEVDDVIRDVKKIPGFHAYAILNNDGIVIKCENMTMRSAVHHAHQVLGLCGKATKYIRQLLEPPDNEIESIRLRTLESEMIIAQHGNYTLLVIQQNANKDVAPAAEEAAAVANDAALEEKKGE